MKKIILSIFLFGTLLSANAQKELKWLTTLDTLKTNVDVLNEYPYNTREFLQLDIKNNQLGIFGSSNSQPFNACLNASDGKVKFEDIKNANEATAGISFDKQGNMYTLSSQYWTGSGNTNSDSYLKKLNQSGQVLFNITINNFTVDFLRQITKSIDSGLFLYGMNRNGSNGYISHSIYKMNPNGSVNFSSTISDLDWYAGNIGRFTLDKGSVIFSGKRQTNQSSENSYDIVLRKVDNKGSQLWQSYYDYNNLCDYIEDLKADNNGDVFMTTNTHTAPNWNTQSARLVKLNGTTGSKIYEKKIGIGGRNDIKLVNNNLYIAISSDSILCLNNATGVTSWKIALSNTYNYRSYYVDTKSNLYVVGERGVLKYSSLGVLEDSFKIKNNVYTYKHYGMQIDSLNNIYIYGERTKGSESKIFVAKIATEVCKLSISSEPTNQSSNINGQVQFNALASDTTSSYQWQSNAADIGWSNLSNNSTYSGVSSKKLTVNNIKVKNHEQIFRVIATKNTCKDTSTVAMLTVNDTCITNVYDTIVTSTTDTLYIKVNTSSLSNPIYNTVKVYPNPSSTQIIIDNGNYSTMGNYNAKIINTAGQQVFQSVINQQQFVIDAKTMGGAGVYTLYITDGNNNVVGVKKIVLQ